MKIKGLRWWVIALIALATVINYIDRQSLSVLWPEIAPELFPDKSVDERKENLCMDLCHFCVFIRFWTGHLWKDF